jgi:hypothetical protein
MIPIWVAEKKFGPLVWTPLANPNSNNQLCANSKKLEKMLSDLLENYIKCCSRKIANERIIEIMDLALIFRNFFPWEMREIEILNNFRTKNSESRIKEPIKNHNIKSSLKNR